MNLIKCGDIIINMDKVECVEIKEDGTVRVWFSHDHSIISNNPSAKELWQRLTDIERERNAA